MNADLSTRYRGLCGEGSGNITISSMFWPTHQSTFFLVPLIMSNYFAGVDKSLHYLSRWDPWKRVLFFRSNRIAVYKMHSGQLPCTRTGLGYLLILSIPMILWILYKYIWFSWRGVRQIVVSVLFLGWSTQVLRRTTTSFIPWPALITNLRETWELNYVFTQQVKYH